MIRAFAALALLGASARAAEPLVFVTAFAPGEKGAIHAYEFDTTAGKLKPLHRNAGVEHPFFLALSPNHKFLYSIHAKNFGGKENEQVAAFALDGRSGKLKLLNRQSSEGTASCYLDVDKTGKMLVVANYSSGSVASLPIKDDGSLGPPASFFEHAGRSVNQQRQNEPHAHCIVVSPDNKYAYAADLGTDEIVGYWLDPATGKLVKRGASLTFMPKGSGPRHLAFHPNGKRAYAINELLNTVTFLEYESDSMALRPWQTISTLPVDFKGTSYTADVKITPDGKYLYGTNRGHDSLACYKIGDDGKLSLLAIEPSLGKGPQNLLITADGRWLLCANMPGNNIAVFRIGDDGKLTSAGAPHEQLSPSCIMLVP